MANSSSNTKVIKIKSLKLDQENKSTPDQTTYFCEYCTQYHPNTTFIAYIRQKTLNKYAEKANGCMPEPKAYYAVFCDGEYINYITDLKAPSF